MIYSTDLGGGGISSASAIAVDAQGNAYITGSISGSGFPGTIPGKRELGGGSDAYVAKFNASGSALEYCTFFGGESGEEGLDIAVDASGNAYVSGDTYSTNFPVTAAAYQRTTTNTQGTSFVIKLNAAGSGLAYSTYFQKPYPYTHAEGIAVDSAGNAWITGTCIEADTDNLNAFVAKLNPSGSALAFLTALGTGSGLGPNTERAYDITLDLQGNVYVVGGSTSPDFPANNSLPGALSGDNGDVFVAKFNSGGGRLYVARFGGSYDDEGWAVAADAQGNAYVTGLTYSTNFPTVNAWDSTKNGGSDVFVAKLNSAGSELVYSTFLGGNDRSGWYECGYGIAVDAWGRAYVSGIAGSSDFPYLDLSPIGHAWPPCGFLAMFNESGSRLLACNLLSVESQGAPVTVESSGVVVDGYDDVYVVSQHAWIIKFQRGPLVVNTIGDASEADLNDQRVDVDPGTPGVQCTLRAALEMAERLPGEDRIEFELPEQVAPTIRPLSALPVVTDPIRIYGTNYPSGQKVELDGSLVTGKANGLHLMCGDSIITDLIINRFPGHGLVLEGKSNHRLRSCFIGTDRTGRVALGNGDDGVHIVNSAHNQIGRRSGAACVISGNLRHGIYLTGAGQVMNDIQGNLIGTDATGTGPLPNGEAGVFIEGASLTSLLLNTISANALGIYISGPHSASNMLSENFIGTDMAGRIGLGNRGPGIVIQDSAGNRVGGYREWEDGNVIAANLGPGIVLAGPGSTNNFIQGNLVGADPTGFGPLGNAGHGIVVTNGASGNWFGISPDDDEDAENPNLWGNIIAFNQGHGIAMAAGCTNNAIRLNSILANRGLEIDLNLDGLTLNDTRDEDEGANRLQNRPVILGIEEPDGSIRKEAFLHSTPSTRFRVEFFCRNLAYLTTNNTTVLGTNDVVTDANGNVTMPVPFAVEFNLITASATDPAGNTSELYIQPLVVNMTGDEPDADPDDSVADVDLVKPGPQTTLRAALEEANRRPGKCQIKFSIRMSDPGYSEQTRIFTIRLANSLPPLTNAVVIDATTQPGYAPGKPVVELRGHAAPSGTDGLVLAAGNSTVAGLIINAFTRHGIVLRQGGTNTIQANFIGTDPAGTSVFDHFSLGNQDGVRIEDSSDNLIGGERPEARNLISGNRGHGIHILGAKSQRNQVQGNWIGTNIEGSNPGADGLGNEHNGIFISGAPTNLIGGASASVRNVISGNERCGIHIQGATAQGNRIQGNFIGTDSSGQLSDVFGGRPLQQPADLANRLDGILIEDAPVNLIGGPAQPAGQPPGNVVSGNVGTFLKKLVEGSAIHIRGVSATGNRIEGNLVGTDVTGTQKLANRGHGIWIENAPGNTIGGGVPGLRNIISGNGTDVLGLDNNTSGNGVLIEGLAAATNRVQGNYIGTDITGTKNLVLFFRSGAVYYNEGNIGSGIAIIDAPFNLVGGLTTAERNLVSGNQGNGLLIYGTNATGNVIQGNLIGPDATGTLPLQPPSTPTELVSNPQGNVTQGILIDQSAHNLIGGPEPGARNIIAFNGLPTSEYASPDGGGIVIRSASDNRIQSNMVFSNGLAGIAINAKRSPDSANRNRLEANSLFGNGGLGIDLEEDSRVQRNDPGDGDPGANTLLNAPVIQSVQQDKPTPGQQTLHGLYQGAPDIEFRLEFYANRSRDPSGFGEGEEHIRSIIIKTDRNGDAAFAEVFPASAPNITVRAAIEFANTNAGLDRLHFDLPITDTNTAPEIILTHALPEVTDALVIDGTTQPGVRRVALLGHAAGPNVSGLLFGEGNHTVGGVIIAGFSGHGIEAESLGILDVDTARIQDNRFWGIALEDAGEVRINRAPGILFPDTVSPTVITNNGTGGEGGGICSLGRVDAHRIEVMGNNGPGILAWKQMDLVSLKVNNNRRGPGLQSLKGIITIRHRSDADTNEVSGNAGPGILAGAGLELPGTPDRTMTGGRPIDIQTSIQVVSNRSWGIFAPNGAVVVNDLQAATSPSQHTSRIAYNGEPTAPVFHADNDGELVELRPGLAAAGGIAAGRGYLVANRIEVSENYGPGLVARKDIDLSVLKVNHNRRGPGIQSLLGTINIRHRSDEDTNEVIGNRGPGILAGLNLTPKIASGTGAIKIGTAIQVVSNSSWGILAPKGAVVLNDIQAVAPPSVHTSRIAHNGDPARGIFIVDEYGDLVRWPDNLFVAGGIAAGRGYLQANRIEVSDNLGPGLVARRDLTLRALQVSRNQRGPGIQSLLGAITIQRRSDPGQDEVSGNAGPGILAGTDAAYSPDRAGQTGEVKDIIIQDAIQVLNNGGWGVLARNGSVVINSLELTPIRPMDSLVNGNGDPNRGCFVIDDTGDLIARGNRRTHGGIGAARGWVEANRLEARNNHGIGVAASKDIYLCVGDVSDNTMGNFIAGGRLDLTDVEQRDLDGDNLSDAVEAMGPSQGDGNQDGIPDSQQAHVTSLLTLPGACLTIAAPADTRVGGVGLLDNAAPPSLPDNAHFPLGLLQLKLDGDNPNTMPASLADVASSQLRPSISQLQTGRVQEVTLFLPENVQAAAYYRYGPTPNQPTNHWYAFEYDGRTGALLSSNRIVLHLVDGERGDDDLLTNGVITHALGGPTIPHTLRLGDLRYQPGGPIQVQLEGLTGLDYRVEASTNLALWTRLCITNAPADRFPVLDTEIPPLPQRFYRAVQIP